MTNLISGGLSYALMSADSSAKAALKPMNMVSRELKKQNPDLELIQRAGKYGGKELNKAEDALAKAQEELIESQKTAKQKEKTEIEEKLKENAEEKKEDKSQKAIEEMAVETLHTSGKSMQEKTNVITNQEDLGEYHADGQSKTIGSLVIGTRMDLMG
jgi:vacuolar-type H+-ATPase subunit H